MHGSVMIQRFMKNHPHLHWAMVNSDHNFSNVELNPYHMEGSVWTHTMMVFNNSLKAKYDRAILLASLFHDVGKPGAREEKFASSKNLNKCSFTGHDGLSFYHTIDILNKSFPELEEWEKIIVAKLVANHSVLFSWAGRKRSGTLEEWISAAFAGEASFFYWLIRLVKSDITGRIGSEELESGDRTLMDFSTFEDIPIHFERENVNDKPELIITVGPPGCGKSTWAVEFSHTHEVISRDSIMVEMTEGDSYKDCWNNQDGNAIDKEVDLQFNAAMAANKNIIIDRTTMSKKSRRRWINMARQHGYYTKCVVFFTGAEVIEERRVARIPDGKDIPGGVIFNMMRGFTYPLTDEVDEVEEIWFNR